MSGLIPVSTVSNSLHLLEDKMGQWEKELNKDAEKTGQEKMATSKAEARKQIAHIRWQIAEMRSKPFQCNIDSISNLFKQLETAQQGFSKGNEQYRKNKLEVMASNDAMQGNIDRCKFDFNPISRKSSLQEAKERSQADIQNEIRGRSMNHSLNKIEAGKTPSSSAKEGPQKKYRFGPEKELKKCLDDKMALYDGKELTVKEGLSKNNGTITNIFADSIPVKEGISKYNGTIANKFADSTFTEKEIRLETRSAVSVLLDRPLHQTGVIALAYTDALEKCSLNKKEEAQKP